jgi:hypothetical protein
VDREKERNHCTAALLHLVAQHDQANHDTTTNAQHAWIMGPFSMPATHVRQHFASSKQVSAC